MAKIHCRQCGKGFKDLNEGHYQDPGFLCNRCHELTKGRGNMVAFFIIIILIFIGGGR